MARTRKEAPAYTVAYPPGLNLREGPSRESAVLRVLEYGEKVFPDPETEAPAGWVAVKGGGYVMREFLK